MWLGGVEHFFRFIDLPDGTKGVILLPTSAGEELNLST